jgi:predicted PurR-regulated permease PerM
MQPIKNPKYLTIALYTIVTVLIIYISIQLLGRIGFIGARLKNIILWIWGGVKPFFIGLLFAYLMDPLVCFYEKRCCLKNKRAVPLFLALLTIVLCIGLFCLIIYLQTRLALGKQNMGDTYVELRESLNIAENIVNQLDQKATEWGILERNKLIQNLYGFINTILVMISQKTMSLFKNIIPKLINIGIGIVMSVYLLRDKSYFIKHYKKNAKQFLPNQINKVLKFIGEALDHVFVGYIRGQLLDAAIMTLLISVALTLIQLDFAMIIGVISGIFNIIPYFGPLVGLAIGGFIGFIGSDPRKGLYAILCIGILQQIDGWFIVPKIMQRTVNIHPVLVILSLYIGGKYFGLVGILLGVPVAAFIRALVLKYVKEEDFEEV